MSPPEENCGLPFSVVLGCFGLICLFVFRFLYRLLRCHGWQKRDVHLWPERCRSFLLQRCCLLSFPSFFVFLKSTGIRTHWLSLAPLKFVSLGLALFPFVSFSESVLGTVLASGSDVRFAISFFFCLVWYRNAVVEFQRLQCLCEVAVEALRGRTLPHTPGVFDPGPSVVQFQVGVRDQTHGEKTCSKVLLGVSEAVRHRGGPRFFSSFSFSLLCRFSWRD